MNIQALAQSIPSINTIETAKEVGSFHQFPREISLRIRTLNLLAHRIIGDAAPLFCQIIDYLDQPKSTISYKMCETLFEEAFIKEFSSDEISSFLSSFFEKFDPEEEFISYHKLNEEGQQFLWQGIIKYFCHEYIGFETSFLSLESIFSYIQEKFDPNNSIIKQSTFGMERKLEEDFDRAMDVVPQFSGDQIMEMKLLLISYCALLITSLKKVEETNDPNLVLDNGFSIQDLFEEIYGLLLQVPFLPPLETAGVTKFHEKLDELDPKSLKERFLTGLVEYLLDTQDLKYEKNAQAIREVMESCFFLDFEYKEFLENIAQSEKG